ncbi:MAG: hypothetical protein ABFC63_01825 [Thermoguttaceae bacterium]
MKIAELEAHCIACANQELAIREMVERRDFPAVFAECITCFEHIVPALSYHKKRGITTKNALPLAIATICTYAPPLFDHAAIKAIDAFVGSSRILQKHEHGYPLIIDAAKRREHTAQQIWNHLEKYPGILEGELGSQLNLGHDEVAQIITIWKTLGIVNCCAKDESPSLWFRTRLDENTVGMCIHCGVHGTGGKKLFLVPRVCKKCGSEGYYHINYSYKPRE